MQKSAQSSKLPAWLWFFIALPLGMLVMLLYRGRRLPRTASLTDRLRAGVLPGNAPRPRYSEPDSIPLNMAGEYASARVRRVSADELSDEADIERMDDESPATANESSPAAFFMREQEISLPEAGAPEPPAAEDDLKKIEGIGPVIAGLLRENGIRNFQQLAVTPNERLVGLLADARLGHLANPATWPEQAQLAAAGQWDALEQLQASLKGGRRKA